MHEFEFTIILMCVSRWIDVLTTSAVVIQVYFRFPCDVIAVHGLDEGWQWPDGGIDERRLLSRYGHRLGGNLRLPVRARNGLWRTHYVYSAGKVMSKHEKCICRYKNWQSFTWAWFQHPWMIFWDICRRRVWSVQLLRCWPTQSPQLHWNHIKQNHYIGRSTFCYFW